ncbi:MAG: hypothetical protein JST82_00155 [Bacteroidetes bacterium]|nr:hypothetical protein [Bacteroidota bacterium]
MSRAITIFLISSLIWVQTPIGQLLKIYTLVEHYYEHKSENKDLSILGFLSMHYAHDTDDHPGHDRDMQLPFKQCSTVSFVISFFEHNGFQLPQKIMYAAVTKSLSRYTSPFHAAEALSKIWQPPRAC